MFGKITVLCVDTKVDVLPLAKLACALLDDDETVDARELAKFYKTLYERGNMRVLKRDNPFGIPYERVNALVARIGTWVSNTHRLRQINDPDLAKARPLAEIEVTHAPCERTMAFHGKIMPVAEVPLLPLPECPLGVCLISISTISRRDAIKRGLV